ncbi:MAG: amidohydrolase, partial [Pseudonocardia sp.]|nr:amidohydrolase [Pseudonocardia sp.]
LLDMLELRGRPLFVHPGPAPPTTATMPAWWPSLVPYVAQMHAAWFAFRAAGRSRHPRLRVCFAMLAGLAPLHGERAAARGGPVTVDADVFVETSSYGPLAVGAVAAAIGTDRIAAGSDEPYARFTDPLPGAAVATTTVARLLGG